MVKVLLSFPEESVVLVCEGERERERGGGREREREREREERKGEREGRRRGKRKGWKEETAQRGVVGRLFQQGKENFTKG